MSPSHFQKMFADWAGVSPKKFVQYLTLTYAKKMLRTEMNSFLDSDKKTATLFQTAFDIGLSGTGRLHDLFVNIEGMTPGEFKNGAESLTIKYSYADSIFGVILIASTHKGICHVAFVNDKTESLQHLKKMFPKANIIFSIEKQHSTIADVFSHSENMVDQIKLHVKGTAFQLKVWEALLTIPSGALSTYGSIAGSINNPKASRAVGSAIGDNPVAYLIPCHRVIQSTGLFGQYMWGAKRKTAMIGWEAAQMEILFKAENK
jgi:AraC family transcriptional regulator, regulatory protein of adaptative response / methylated-DNA-[protein]-cysteine methyltransferase